MTYKLGGLMITVDDILSVQSWRQLKVPKTPEDFKEIRRKIHPDINKNPHAHEAFAKLTELYNGPDFSLRVAEGTSQKDHKILWKPKRDFNDRVSVVVKALKTLDKLPTEFSRFFPKLDSYVSDHVIISYGEGWWFLDSFPELDSRTIVWIAKRGAAAIKKSAECGLVHGDINPKTVVILPSDHGLMLDGWWHSVPVGSRLELKPDAPTPAKYFGGARADEQLMVSQLASMLTRVGKPDRLLLEVLKRHSLGTTDAVIFFNEINNAAKKLYGPSSWHPLNNPSVEMI